jgi:hypothetical protein
MAHQAEYPWKGHPRLVAMEYSDRVSADEVTASLEFLAELMDQATMPLHTIFSFAKASTLPEKLLNLMKDSRVVSHHQRGYFVFVDSDEFVKMIAKILRGEADVSIAFSADVDEAWEFFNDMGIC